MTAVSQGMNFSAATTLVSPGSIGVPSSASTSSGSPVFSLTAGRPISAAWRRPRLSVSNEALTCCGVKCGFEEGVIVELGRIVEIARLVSQLPAVHLEG